MTMKRKLEVTSVAHVLALSPTTMTEEKATNSKDFTTTVMGFHAVAAAVLGMEAIILSAAGAARETALGAPAARTWAGAKGPAALPAAHSQSQGGSGAEATNTRQPTIRLQWTVAARTITSSSSRISVRRWRRVRGRRSLCSRSSSPNNSLRVRAQAWSAASPPLALLLPRLLPLLPLSLPHQRGHHRRLHLLPLFRRRRKPPLPLLRLR